MSIILTFKFKMWIGEELCYLNLSKYVADSSLALSLVSVDGEPITTLTVCLHYDDESIKLEEGYCYIDNNNNPYAEEFIITNKLGSYARKPNGDVIYKRSGYCNYPLFKMNMDYLRKVCCRNYYDN